MYRVYVFFLYTSRRIEYQAPFNFGIDNFSRMYNNVVLQCILRTTILQLSALLTKILYLRESQRSLVQRDSAQDHAIIKIIRAAVVEYVFQSLIFPEALVIRVLPKTPYVPFSLNYCLRGNSYINLYTYYVQNFKASFRVNSSLYIKRIEKISWDIE